MSPSLLSLCSSSRLLSFFSFVLLRSSSCSSFLLFFIFSPRPFSFVSLALHTGTQDWHVGRGQLEADTAPAPASVSVRLLGVRVGAGVRVSAGPDHTLHPMEVGAPPIHRVALVHDAHPHVRHEYGKQTERVEGQVGE